MHELVRVQQCHGGVVHLTVGATTLHMDTAIFRVLAQSVVQFYHQSISTPPEPGAGLRLVKDHLVRDHLVREK